MWNGSDIAVECVDQPRVIHLDGNFGDFDQVDGVGSVKHVSETSAAELAKDVLNGVFGVVVQHTLHEAAPSDCVH
jgi:hypothetical protein